MTTLRIATTNRGKLVEFKQMLEPLGYVVHGVEDLPDFDVLEDGDSFAANAIKKAQALLALTGETAIADDSGLVVDALAGAPGVHSARYAGVTGPGKDAANRAKLLAALAQTPEGQRQARFVCALAFCAPDAPARLFHGTLEGTIGFVERGDHGFGYDSLFVIPRYGRTAAEISSTEKHEVSHRGQAVTALVKFLAERRG